ncbi:MAG: hypothetical protein UX37_C0010G0002 [Microgenomates group bacterium GW2011_GWA2_46_16]|nr:MAG: hypothetical protein UX37_C0010G0002 [Microgenomates group bacterium GW2011_GWA2_46_16]
MSIKDMSFIKSRLEKLATAVFMVTNYIDSTEPLRTNLRKLVLDIISERQDDLNDLSDRVDRVLSVIKIGKSPMSNVGKHPLPTSPLLRGRCRSLPVRQAGRRG